VVTARRNLRPVSCPAIQLRRPAGMLWGVFFLLAVGSAVGEELRTSWERSSTGELVLTVQLDAPSFVPTADGMRQLPPLSRWAFALPDRALYGFALLLRLPPQTELSTEVLRWQELPLEAPLAQRRCTECRPEDPPLARLLPLGSTGEHSIAALQLFPYTLDTERHRVRIAREFRVRFRSPVPFSAGIPVIEPSSVPASARSTAGRELLQGEPHRIPTAPDGYQYKLIVDRDGLYRVTARQLQELGIPLATIPVESFRLWNRGREIPLYVYDRNNNGRLDDYPPDPDYLAFFAEANRVSFQNPYGDMYRDPETDENVYVLTWAPGKGQRMVEESGDIRISDPRRMVDLRGRAFLSTVIVEENRLEERFGSVEELDRDLLLPSFRGDQLFWARVPANTSVTVPIRLPAPALLAPDPVEVEVMLCGALARPLPCPIPPYTAEIYLNRRRILRASWSDARPFLVRSPRDQIAPIPASLLAEADSSTLTVANIFDCPEAADRAPSFFLNWVRIRYPRLYVATDDELLFRTPEGSPPGLYTFALEGFRTPNILLFRYGVSRIVNFSLERVTLPFGGVRYTVRFQSYVASPEELFYAIAADSVRTPRRLVRDFPSDLVNPANAADYLLITHKGLWDRQTPEAVSPTHPVQRLLQLRQRQGLRAMAVDIEDIYDEFNYGIASREALRRFLRYAWHTWSVPPRYVLLLGSARPLPPQLWQTRRWGMTPTDYPYGCVEGTYQTPTGALTDDPFAEIAIGRIPAETLAEADAVISKLEEHEGRYATEYFHPRVLLLAGLNGFQQQTELLAERLPPGISQRRLYVAPGTPYSGHTSELLQLFAEGAAVVNFLGHGGGGIWEDAGLLRDEDVELLQNRGRYPIVSSLTCFTGAFEQQVYRRGLLTSLVIAPRRGAVAAWGNSGYGWLENSFLLSTALLEVLTRPTGTEQRLGDVFRGGKLLYAARAYGLQNEIVLSMLLQSTLLGDPAMLLRLPPDTLRLEAEPATAYPGDSLTVQAVLPFGSGTARLLLTDERGNDLPGSEQVVSLSGTRLRWSVRIPATYTGSRLSVRLYVVSADGTRALSGGVTLSTGAVLLGEIQSNPSPPVPGQPLAFRISVRSRTPVQTVTATVSVLLPDGTLSSLGTLPCQLVAPELYQTQPPVPAASVVAGAEFRVLFTVTLSTGQSVSSWLATFRVPGIADPAVLLPLAGDSLRTALPWLRMVVTGQGAQLQARLYNWSETPAGAVLARLWQRQPGGGLQLLAAQRLDIPGNGFTDWLLRPPPALRPRWLRLEVLSDTLSTGGDRIQANNAAEDSLLLGCFAVMPGLGTTPDGVQATAVGVPGIAVVEVPAAAAPSTPVLLCLQVLDSARTVQPDVFLLHLADSSRALAITTAQPLRATLQLWYDRQDSSLQRGTPALYRKHSRLDLWQRLPSSELSPGVLTAEVTLPGVFAVGVTTDRRPPQVRLTAEGRSLPTRTVLSAYPRIGIVGVDENGIATDTGSIQLTLNGQPVPASQYAVLDTAQTPTAASISYRPRLESGTHIICATLTDCNGNTSERTCIQVEVSTTLELRLLGTFPNPFAEEMFIAYELLGASNVDEIEVRFYTASGRSIRRMVFPTSSPTEAFGFLRGGTGLPTAPGYHEIWWDGTDDEGRPVANGVYFYRVRVRAGETVIERRGSVARVR